jgi:hypothetical protein
MYTLQYIILRTVTHQNAINAANHLGNLKLSMLGAVKYFTKFIRTIYSNTKTIVP